MMMWLPPKYAVSQVVCYIKDKSAIHLPVCDQSNRKITGPQTPILIMRLCSAAGAMAGRCYFVFDAIPGASAS